MGGLLWGEAAIAQEQGPPDASTPSVSEPPAPPSASLPHPDEDWGGFPPDEGKPPPKVVLEPLPGSGPSLAAPGPRSGVKAQLRPPKPEDFNNVSLFGAPALGQWNRGVAAYLGFPLLGARALVGLGDRLDVGLGFDSFYGLMNEFRVVAKYQVLAGTRWTGAFHLEGGRAFFGQRAGAESRGARWLTGRRNYNVVPGFVLSYRGESPRSARMFLDFQYQLSLDTEPYQRDPLGGVPAAVQVGHNVPIRAGAEMPFSPKTSFLFVLGFDVHGRADDAPFMPFCVVGLVTSI